MAYGYLFEGRNRVTQCWGNNGHTGIDVVGDDSTTVHCCVAGTVEKIHDWDGVTTSQSSDESYGNYVVIKDSNGYRYRYAHLKSYSVKVGQTMKVGDTIGIMGSTGNSTGAHTHFEVRTGTSTSTRINPAPYCCLSNALGTYYSTTVTAVSGYSTYTVVSGSKSLNYRAKPSTSGTVKGTLANNAQVLVADSYMATADGYTWFKVRIGSTDYYAAAKYLQLVLDVDGGWGKLTTLRLQDYFGCSIRDGKVSNQYKMYESSNPGCTSGWEWVLDDNDKGTKCSIVIKAFQKAVGMASSEQDGHVGPITFKAAQKHFSTTQDGVLSNPSAMVRVMQDKLNKGTF